MEGMSVLKPDAKGSTSEECDTLARLHGELLAAEKSIMIAESNLKEAKSTEQMPCIGGTLVFSDLAGSEHAGSAMDGLQKTKQEQQECREINKSLSALKACFRNLASGLSSTSCYCQVETHHGATGPSALGRLQNTDDCQVVSLCTTHCQNHPYLAICSNRIGVSTD